jgi:hypothetical protein
MTSAGKRDSRSTRMDVLRRHTSSPKVIAELMAYNQNRFDLTGVVEPRDWPLDDEPHVSAWEKYTRLGSTEGVESVLRRVLVQTHFPIRKGMSKDPSYLAATRRGILPGGVADGTDRDRAEPGVVFESPQQLEIILHPTPAGRIPAIIAPARADFESLVRAVIGHNEPMHIPQSMGAAMVAGYNNWHRIAQLRASWMSERGMFATEAGWLAHFSSTIMPEHALYQDRLVILHGGPYSNVLAPELGLDEEEWRGLSIRIRLAHESTHYLTRKVLGSMSDNLFDELLADYRGITAAHGTYSAAWFLRFMGLEDFPDYRAGGRMENYCGSPPLSDAAQVVERVLLRDAARAIERFHGRHASSLQGMQGEARAVLALSRLTLEEIASPSADGLLDEMLDSIPVGGSRRRSAG